MRLLEGFGKNIQFIEIIEVSMMADIRESVSELAYYRERLFTQTSSLPNSEAE